MNWTINYRPRQIEELTLTSVRSTVLKWLDKGWIPQTLLFTGPKGTGKTTTARLLAATLNDPRNQKAVELTYLAHQPGKSKFLPPQAGDSLSDQILRGNSYAVLEIDAASHRGIDDVRQLRDQLQLSPTSGTMLVCILDEAHMLTKEAWNALLKTMEEPPSHVILVLATTELHKVPATIQSRCQLLQFSQPTVDELVETLQRVAKNEKIKINQNQLASIAQQADGSVRDAIKLLERLVTEGRVDQDQQDLAQLNQDLIQFVTSIVAKQAPEFSNLCQQLRNKGTDERFFQTQLLTALHQDLKSHLLQKPTQFDQLSQPAIEFLLKEFIDADLSAQSLIPFLKLELRGLSIIARASKNQSSGNSGKSTVDQSVDSSSQKSNVTPNSFQGPVGKSKSRHADPISLHSGLACPEESWNPESQNLITGQNQLVENQLHGDAIDPNSINLLATISTDVVDSIIPMTNLIETVDQSLATIQNDQISNSLPNDDTISNVDPVDSTAAERLLAHWRDFTEAVTAYNQTLAAIIRSARPEILSHCSVRLNLTHQFHVERIDSPKTRQALEQAAQLICHSPITLEALAVAPVRVSPTSDKNSPDLVALATQALT